MNRRTARAILLGIAIGTLGVCVPAFVETDLEEQIGLSWLFHLRGPRVPPDDIVVVAIDREASEKLEVGPRLMDWPREMHARLVNNLIGGGAALVVFDMYFTEEDRDDPLFATALAATDRVVILEYMTYESDPDRYSLTDWDPNVAAIASAASGSGPFPLSSSATETNLVAFDTFVDLAGMRPTLPALALHVYATLGSDDYTRIMNASAFERSGGPIVSSASRAERLRQEMAMLRAELSNDPDRLAETLRRIRSDEAISDAARRRLVSLMRMYAARDRHILNFYGGPGTIPFIGYADFLMNPDSVDVTDKVVFVGNAESALIDQEDSFRTVFRRSDGLELSGVEVAATAFANLASIRTLRRSFILDLAVILSVGVLACLLSFHFSGSRAVVGLVGFGLVFVLFALVLFKWNMWIPVFYPVALEVPLALVFGLLFQYRETKDESDRYREWVPAKATEHSKFTGTVYCAVLRTDLQGSSALSTRMDLGDFDALLAEYHSIVRRAVSAHDGRSEVVKGDDFVSYWEADREHPAYARAACLAAVQVRDSIRELNRFRSPESRLVVRIGVHAGWAESRPDRGIVGPVPNTVAFIERANKALATETLATEQAVEGVADVVVRRLGLFEFERGMSAVGVVELLGFENTVDEATRKLCRRFHSAMLLFEQARWSQAVRAFGALLDDFPEDGPIRYFLDRAERNEKDGATWDSPVRLHVK